MSRVALSGITKRFDAVVAVDDLTLEIEDREFLVLLGPSGCGKSTALRMIAGLEDPTAGTIRIGDRIVNDVDPKDRDIAMVFQSYALYPHMTVRRNIEFPLRSRHVDKRDRQERVTEAAASLGLTELLDRKPAQLSGGQRQRVALARAIVRRPSAFLMDEPLSNLDAKLRVQTRAELIELQRALEATIVYVTHDQVEAMGLGDRIAVLSEGRIQQIGTPDEIYHQPANTFVATFVGSPPMNLLTRDGKLLGFRPEQFLPASAAGERPGQVIFDFAVTRVENLGSDRYVYGHLPGVDPEAKVIAKLPSTVTTPVYVGDRVPFAVSGSDLRYFDQQSGTLTAPGEAAVKP